MSTHSINRETKMATFRLTSSMYLTLKLNNDNLGKVDLSGHSSKVLEKEVKVIALDLKDEDAFVIRNIGAMIE